MDTPEETPQTNHVTEGHRDAARLLLSRKFEGEELEEELAQALLSLNAHLNTALQMQPTNLNS